MGFWSRIKLWLKIKTSAAIDHGEDPRQVMAYAYDQQQEFLRTVKQGLIEVATAKQQLQQQVERQRGQIPHLENQAKQALAVGREDLARIALHRKQTALKELNGLEGQLAEITEEEQRLAVAQQQIAARISTFRTHRDVVSARYTAAEAQVRINQSLIGVSGELGELSLALGRAEEKTQQMLARASALQTLIDSGVLETPYASGDLVEIELFKLRADNAVEEELGLLKSSQRREQLPPPSE